MKPDAIFRIYSMTKPIVSVAVMQMVEEGKLQVSDPERAMTVQDLLRHTSGLT